MVFDFLKKHSNLIVFIGLCIIFYFIFFYGIGTYALMDIDETRYASMAHDMFNSKDYMTLYLNGEYFFEKPPLYFWLECLSFGFFKTVNEFTVRFPVSLLGMLSCFLVYFSGKKIISRKFGLISALILATSTEFFILSKFAILDIVLCFCTTFSIFFGFLTLFCEEKNKKWFWWLFYIFSGLAVLAKGIPGFVLPFGTMFFSYVIAKKFKELFKPLYFIPGVLIFIAIVLPWHILMLEKHNPLFFNEYIMKHHIARFTTSAELGRKQPFYFFILTIFGGFFPWIIPAIVTCKSWIKKVFETFQSGFNFENMDNTQKFITVNAIAAILTLVFFSSSSTKLITYILPIYPFLACLTAIIFYNDENEKTNNIISLILGIFFGFIGLLIPVATCYLYMNDKFADILDKFISPNIIFIVSTMFIVSALFMIFAKKLKNGAFIALVFFMILLSAFGTPIGFNIDYKFGQNDLMEYAKLANQQNNTLASFGFGRRYSLNYYYKGHVIYEQLPLYENLNNLLKDKKTVIVIKNKNIDEYKNHSEFKILSKGMKYSLIQGK